MSEEVEDTVEHQTLKEVVIKLQITVAILAETIKHQHESPCVNLLVAQEDLKESREDLKVIEGKLDKFSNTLFAGCCTLLVAAIIAILFKGNA